MTEVFVVSHHEGLVAVAATEELANRIRDGFVGQFHHTYGKPWVERVRVFYDSEPVWDDAVGGLSVTTQEPQQ